MVIALTTSLAAFSGRTRRDTFPASPDPDPRLHLVPRALDRLPRVEPPRQMEVTDVVLVDRRASSSLRHSAGR